METLRNFLLESFLSKSTELAINKNIESEDIFLNTNITIKKAKNGCVKYSFDNISIFVQPEPDEDGENQVFLPEDDLNLHIAKMTYNILKDLKKSDKTFNPTIYIKKSQENSSILKSAGFKSITIPISGVTYFTI